MVCAILKKVRMDVKYLLQMQTRRSSATCWWPLTGPRAGLCGIKQSKKSTASAKAFLSPLHKAYPIRITKRLSDNGKEFTERLFASRNRQPTGHHRLDLLCQVLGIEHWLLMHGVVALAEKPLGLGAELVAGNVKKGSHQ